MCYAYRPNRMKTKKTTAAKAPKAAQAPKVKKPAKTPKARRPDLQDGQVWKVNEQDRVQIRLVGKRLVHYRHFKGGNVRPPTLFAGKDVLEKFLATNKAMLVSK